MYFSELNDKMECSLLEVTGMQINFKSIHSEEDVNLISTLYSKVWRQDSEGIFQRIKKHMDYDGFQGHMILSEENKLIGFAYGYFSLKGQYYHDLIANHLNQQEYQDWLSNCYEVVEIIVDSYYRKLGYGRELLDSLLKGAKTTTAILTTQQDNMTAIQFYKNQHWELVKEQFYPNEDGKAFVIFGKRLKRQ